jgi:PucR family transcriptional regulator, purine catabolism regulatory protein
MGFTDLEVYKVVENEKQLDRIERYKVTWKGKDIQKTVFPIVAGSEKLGLLIIWELNQLSRLSIAALERSISIAAYEIMKSFAIIATENKYKNIVLDQLLTSDIQLLNNARDRAKIFGWELEKPYCVFVVKLEEKSRQKLFQKDNYLDRAYYLVRKAVEKISPKGVRTKTWR